MIQLLPLALGLVVATSTAAPAVTPGTYTYTASLNGAAIGTSAITVTANSSTTVIDEKGTATVQGQAGNASDTLTLDATLAPSTYQANANIGAQNIKDSATFSGTSASVNGLQGAKSFALPATAKHFVVLDLGTLSGFIALPAQMKAWNNAPVLAIVPSYGQSVALSPAAGPALAHPATVPAADVALSFGGQFPFTLWYDPASLVTDEIDVPAQGLSVTRKP